MADADRAYYQRTLELLEDSCLEADARGDVAGGSGSGGGLARWECKRRVIARAFDHDGDWLDAGCANGLLMETLTGWVAEAGWRIEPYGLDLSARIAERARQRLPHWADRIWAGNVMEWTPPRRFDYVTVIADCVPPDHRAAMVERIARVYLNPRGRLVFSCYKSSAVGRPEEAAATLLGFGYQLAGAEELVLDGVLNNTVAWDRHQRVKPSFASAS
jgi:SAM-dependent methyltransferase